MMFCRVSRAALTAHPLGHDAGRVGLALLLAGMRRPLAAGVAIGEDDGLSHWMR